METSLVITGLMTLFRPLLESASTSAAETIGEKITEKGLEKLTWQKIKSLFVVEEEMQAIQVIENKPTATSQDIQLIENKLTNVLTSDPQQAAELQALLFTNQADKFEAKLLLESIQRDKAKLEELYEDKNDASIETEGSYKIMIRRTKKRLKKDEQDFLKLLHQN